MSSRIEDALTRILAGTARQAPPKLAAAIEHAVFPGGARLRPRLCLAVADADDNDAPDLAEAMACAIELLHCASLVHDDLPCFDDADLRRGRPSVHRAFGEQIAVLVGDALIVQAFAAVAGAAAAAPARVPGLIAILGEAAGAARGLVAGQAWESEPCPNLDRYHQAKTGALFVAAAMGGALAAGRAPEPWRAMGAGLGAAYQVADDLFDAHAGPGDAGGKPLRQDTTLLRPSAVTAHGTLGAVERLRTLTGQAAAAIPSCRGRAGLEALVAQTAERLVPASLRQSAA
jgi:geranylgeranyl diphosphate synthase type II